MKRLALFLGVLFFAWPAFGQADFDQDGFVDTNDNCVYIPNPSQIDTDGDNFGNACDGDFYNPGDVLTAAADADGDADGDCKIGGGDFGVIVGAFGFNENGNGAADAQNPGMHADWYARADMNEDGIVGGIDFGRFVAQLKQGTPGASTQTALGEITCIAQNSIDLDVLDIPLSRIPDWSVRGLDGKPLGHPAYVAEAVYNAAQAWPEYDATCECADNDCVADGTGTDANGASCTAATGTIPFPQGWGCSPADAADDADTDYGQINCLLATAPDMSVIYLPNGTYRMGYARAQGQMIKITRSNRVLRCEDNTSTILRSGKRCGDGSCTLNPGDVGVHFGAAGGSFGGFPPAGNAGATHISIGGGARGPNLDWTGGYTNKQRDITVGDASGLNAGDWLELQVLNPDVHCPTKYSANDGHPGAANNAALIHVAKILDVNGLTVLLDSGLRDAVNDEDPLCSTLTNAYRWTSFTQNVGIENCHITHNATDFPDPNNQDQVRDQRALALGPGTVESWIVGNRFTRQGENSAHTKWGRRNWIQGNIWDEVGDDKNGNSATLDLGRGSGENVIENNYITNYVTGFYNWGGAEGNVIAYNYFVDGSPPSLPERSMMNHGSWTRQNLFEGNDAENLMMITDSYWGPNGKHNTAYRNRLTDDDKRASIGHNRDVKADPPNIGTRTGYDYNVIGNTAYAYYLNEMGGAWNTPNFIGFEIDGNRTSGSPGAVRPWYERNVWRRPTDCPGSTCAFAAITPWPDTSCGTGGALPDCDYAAGPPETMGDNAEGTAAPAAWSTDAVTSSFYRYMYADEPAWWCWESPNWLDIQGGIGAWGDNCGDEPCSAANVRDLPAQIMAEAGTCTPCTSGNPGVETGCD